VGILGRVPPLSELADAELTYPEVGASSGVLLPVGYRHVVRSATLGRGRDVFDHSARALLGWELHLRAGLRVHASSPVAYEGGVVATVLGVGRVGVVAPCRVVRVVNEPNRRGFAYGTLRGHPKVGEESFVVSYAGDGIDGTDGTDGTDGFVTFDLRAFSRHASWLVRVGSPLARQVQDWMTDRFVRAAEAIAAETADRPVTAP
jgi:uncharacterized protein (UPF0548 family)